MFCIPYTILTLFLGALAFLSSNTEDPTYRSMFTAIGIVFFIFFFGFRGFIMSDWIVYHDLFYNCTFNDIKNFQLSSSGYIEPGFTLLMLICKSIFNDYHFFVFISTIINTLLLLNFLRKHSTNILLGLMLFIVFDGLTIMVNLMRNAIAILLFLNAITYLQHRKPIQYFSLCFIAITFHISALIYIPIYFLFQLTIPRWLFCLIIIVFNLIFLLHIPLFAHILSYTGLDAEKIDKVVAYTQKMTTTSKLSIGFIERTLTSILIICYFNRLHKIRKRAEIFINSYLMYAMFLLVFSDFPVIGHRMANLFAFSYWIIWGDLIRCFSIENNKRLFAIFIYCYCALRIAGSTQLPDFEYDNILFGAKSYEERLYIHNKTFEETY